MAKIKLFKRTRRNLPLLKRDLLGFTGHELVQVNILANKLDFLKQKYRELSASPRTSRLPSLQSTLVRIRYYIGQIRAAYRDIAAVEVDEKLLKDLLNGQGGRHVPRMTLDSMEQKLRIERSKILLETTQLRFSEIVQRCGYQDESAFRRLFKRYCQMTPREYRQRFVREPALNIENEVRH